MAKHAVRYSLEGKSQRTINVITARQTNDAETIQEIKKVLMEEHMCPEIDIEIHSVDGVPVPAAAKKQAGLPTPEPSKPAGFPAPEEVAAMKRQELDTLAAQLELGDTKDTRTDELRTKINAAIVAKSAS